MIGLVNGVQKPFLLNHRILLFLWATLSHINKYYIMSRHLSIKKLKNKEYLGIIKNNKENLNPLPGIFKDKSGFK